jgi:hypothetical protein
MRYASAVLCALAVCVVLTACGGSGRSLPGPVTTVSAPPLNPPSPASWPAYPHFSQHSCWGRPFPKGSDGTVSQVAPSYAPQPRAHPIRPAVVASRLLSRFGDSRYVRSITFAAAPPAVGGRVHTYYGGGHPPADALTASVNVRATIPSAASHPSPTEILDNAVANWEADLVGGALRDDLCAAGGAPLVAWSPEPGGGGGFAESWWALGQHFPNPSPAAFRKRVRLVGRRYGFRISSLRLLRPRQLAPLLVVETRRNRKAFVHDVPAIVSLLDPTTSDGHQHAITFEGFLFEARDARGPFVETDGAQRGESMGSEWSWNPNVFPFTHG